MRKPVSLLVILFFGMLSSASAAGIFAGYAGNKWGTDMHVIAKSYPKGEMAQLGGQLLYKQKSPNKDMRQRTFAFRENRLSAVTVTFNPAYVKKVGIENLLKKHKNSYGPGQLDNSSAPHMVTYRWEDASTKITFAYAPKRADMTILMYEKK